MTLRYESILGGTFVLLAALLGGACSSEDRRSKDGSTDELGGSGSGSGSSTGGNSGIKLGGTSGIQLNPSTGPDPDDKRDVPVRERVCDDQGKCTCLRLALLGTLDSAALNKDTKPFTDWLNDNSNGTATITMVTTKPTIDDAFLEKYDILLVANVNTWSFSSNEKAAVEKWVREKGGGIVALSGFVSTEKEPAATSQLISFSGVHFEATDKNTAAENGQNKPVYYQDGTTDLKQCLAWTGNSEAIITTPIKFQPQSGSLAKLTHELDYVGAMVGWGVSAPAGATVVAKDPVSNANIAVAMEVDGKGRIFAYGDEWTLFANQWAPVGNPHNQQKDQHNICWHEGSGGSEGFFHSVKSLYQTKQFWYNAINWVAPPNECSFVVDDPDVITILR